MVNLLGILRDAEPIAVPVLLVGEYNASVPLDWKRQQSFG